MIVEFHTTESMDSALNPEPLPRYRAEEFGYQNWHNIGYKALFSQLVVKPDTTLVPTGGIVTGGWVQARAIRITSGSYERSSASRRREARPESCRNDDLLS